MSLSDRCEELERELAETRAIIDKEAQDYAQTYLDNQALSAQVLQLRECVLASTEYRQGNPAFEAALDTKPAESVINAVKAQALREAAEWLSTNTYVYGAKELYRRADELEKK